MTIFFSKEKKKMLRTLRLEKIGGPNGNRTRVLALRGPRPRPLDDGTIMAGERGFEPL